MEIEGKQKMETAVHEDKFEASVFEAARKAVFQITGLRPNVGASTGTIGGGRKNCSAEVQLAVRKNGKKIVGKAEHRDSFKAEITAYIDALNKL
jgi:hypothetical protein